MSISRRRFVHVGTTAAMAGMMPSSRIFRQPLFTTDGGALNETATVMQESEMRDLALRAVDAARSMGAKYADVRLTRIVKQAFGHRSTYRPQVSDGENFGFGVRALVDGAWGFASSPYWEPEESIQLVKSAVSQAKANKLGDIEPIDWTALPAATGSWVCPGVDPFSITIEEKADFMNAWRNLVGETFVPENGVGIGDGKMEFERREWFMASTEGTAVSQLHFTGTGEFPVGLVSKDWLTSQQQGPISSAAHNLELQLGGWDLFLKAKLREQIRALAEESIEKSKLSAKPVDIGKFDVVFAAQPAAGLVASTFGIATQLDRAIGLEANAGGTSYLGPKPMDFLGQQVGDGQVNVGGSRSVENGLATVKWDDEGVAPEDFDLVKDGILVDYQTTREQAPWLKEWYAKRNMPIRSHGCASAWSALNIPIQQPPNLVLKAGKTDATFESMVAGIKRGYAVIQGGARSDHQARNGMIVGFVREIVNGKLGDVAVGAGMLYSSMELWKNVTAVGGESSVSKFPMMSYKGQPTQQSAYSTVAVPITVKNMTTIDVRRRA